MPDSGLTFLDPDTPVSPGSELAARLAVGAVCGAVDAVLSDQAARVFCAVRPPGHHAEPSRAMGFCLYSTIAIGAKHALDEKGLERVAIVDFDVHHGNGTEAVARQDPRILFLSSHEWGNYPGTGHPDDRGHHDNLRNYALPRGAGGAQIRPIFEREIIPELERFEPEILMISAGFDAHRADPLGGLALEAEDFGWITALLCALADNVCDGRVVSALEGGYDLTGLQESVASHIDSLAGS